VDPWILEHGRVRGQKRENSDWPCTRKGQLLNEGANEPKIKKEKGQAKVAKWSFYPRKQKASAQFAVCRPMERHPEA